MGKKIIFEIPEGTAPSKCSGCGAKVYWTQHPRTGGKMILDPDGQSHFSSCPQADRFRKKR